MKRVQRKHTLHKVIVTGTMISLLLMAAGCKKKETPTIVDETIITPIVTSALEPTLAPTPIAMTPAPGVTITPTITPTFSPTPTPAVLLTLEEAEAKLKEKIDSTKYTYVLSDDNLNIEGKVYYIYVIFEGDLELQPAILVDAKDGTLFYYDVDGNVTEFTRFPVDKTESISSGEHEISIQSALVLLQKMKKEKLGLANNLSKYTIVADEWTTIINGDECYCFNVFEGSEAGQLADRFYVSTSGTAIYKIDDVYGEFIKIN